jgi:hypothetical protein
MPLRLHSNESPAQTLSYTQDSEALFSLFACGWFKILKALEEKCSLGGLFDENANEGFF